MGNAETACTGHDFAKPGDLQHRNPKKVFFIVGGIPYRHVSMLFVL